jgi:hypothetical protein
MSRVSVYLMLIILCLSLKLAFATNTTEKVILSNNLKTILDARQFSLVGETTFSIFFWDLYKSQLLTTSGKYPVEIEKENILFDINYLVGISSDDLIKNTIDQWQHLGIAHEIYEGYLPELKAIWPNIKEDDSLSLLIQQKRSVFYFNKQYIGVINDAEFGQLFLAIWLSENTSEPSLRLELLGSIKDE